MIIAVAVVGCLCFAGGYFIGGGDGEDTTPVMVSGSTTVQPLMNAWASEYEKISDAAIYVSGGGSGTGRTNANTKLSDIGMASSATSSASFPNLVQHTIAFDAVVIVANFGSGAAITSLTINDLKVLFLEAPGVTADTAALPTLTPIYREYGSGTRETFVTSLGGLTDNDPSNTRGPFKLTGLERTSAGAMLRYINDTPNTIGFVNMNSLSEISGGTNVIYPNVKSLAVGVAGSAPANHIVPSAVSVQAWMNGDTATGYPMSRALFVLTLADGSGLSPTAIGFLQWMYSAEAQQIVDDEGFVHLDPVTLKAQWEKVLRWPAI